MWRKKVLHREDIDLALKHGLPVLKKIYERFSGKYASPGAAHYMSMIEFQELFQDSGIFNDQFGTKMLPQQFTLSMMTQVDEIDSDRHMNMSFCEFMEGLVRVAENLAIPNLVQDYYNIGEIVDGSVTEEDKAEYAKRTLP